MEERDGGSLDGKEGEVGGKGKQRKRQEEEQLIEEI